MRVLLTGATGFIGSHVLPMLLHSGHEVLAIGRQEENPLPHQIRWITWDLAAGRPTEALPKADAVIHLAQAKARFPEDAVASHAVSCEALVRLLDHASRCGAERFILASTGNVYGFGRRPFTEADPQRPADFYGRIKCHAEHLVESYREWLRTAVLRIFAPYGPGQTGRLIPDIISRVRDKRPVILKGGGQPRLTPIFITDLCGLIVKSLTAASSNLTLNLAGDEQAGLNDIATLAGEALGIAPIFEHSPEPAIGNLMGDNSEMKAMLGAASLVPLREGLAQTARRLSA